MAAAAFFNAAKLADSIGKVSPLLGDIFRYLATKVTGADDNIVTGTAGTSGNLVQWNADGDVVDSGVSSASIITSHTTIQVDGVAVSAGAVTLDFDGTDFTLTESPTDDFDITIKAERIQDIVGAMVTGNTETLITVTYQDADGTLDFEITDAGLTAIANATITAVSGADATLITGTEGTSGNVAMWNADGDLVDASVVAANILVDGDIGSAVQGYDATLAALASYNTNGLLTQTAADTFTGRTITGTSNEIDVSNGDGVSGNPTLRIPDNLVTRSTVTIANTGLHLLDTDASHDLIIKPGSNLTTADKTLTLTTGDADRTLTISGDTTLGGGSHSGTNTGDQTITLTGNVTGSGTGSFAATIADEAVTYAKMQHVSATARLLGRTTAGAGDVEEIAEATLKSTFNLEAGTDFHAYTANGNTILTDAGVLAVANATITAVSGADATLITGTEGTSGNVAMWNADGDLVDASVAAADVLADGDTLATGLYFPNGGVKIQGIASSNYLALKTNSNYSVERDLIIDTNDADRTLTISANATISGTNTGNVTLAGTPDYITISGQVITRNAIDLSTDTTGVLNLTSGQITFPATQNASSDANTLDDYEEGTWTPVLLDNTLSASESQAYSEQSGDYIKIGRMVFASCTMIMTSLGTLTTTQQTRVGGLPFVPDSSPSWQTGGVYGANLNLAAANSVIALANAGTTDHFLMYKWSATTGPAAMAISELSADGQIRVTCVYQATA